MTTQAHEISSSSSVPSTTEQNGLNSSTSSNMDVKSTWNQSMQLSDFLSVLGSFVKTLYLFPSNDVQTMIIPVTCIGISGALTNSYSDALSSISSDADILAHLLIIPRTFLWVYLNVLLFAISNQRSPKSVLEDSINKSWRPIPSGRITSSSARRLLFVLIPILLLVSHYFLGACEETMLCLLLTWMYNDLGGSDEHFFVRNTINSLAYFVYGSGALRVAAGSSTTISTDARLWLGIISAIIFSTMQVQDLKDQDGDRATNRDTLPLSIGDSFCRYTVAFGVLTWSFATPRYWSVSFHSSGSTLPVFLGTLVAYRVLMYRSPKADTQTYKAWSAWLMSVCFLPLFRHLPSFRSFFQGPIFFGIPQASIKTYTNLTLSSIVVYVVLVRILRHRRFNQHKRISVSTLNASDSGLSLYTAQSIYNSLFNAEFPFMFMKGIQLALFRQYSIPSISRVLVRTGRLSCPRRISLRYAETEILFLEFSLRQWGSPRWMEAMAKTKAIHSKMRESGMASEEDMLYTLATLATQPVELVEKYEWRSLNEVELCAIGTLYRGISDALEIDYSAFLNPHFSTAQCQFQKEDSPRSGQLPSGLDFYHALKHWQASYESQNFGYTPDAHLLATTGAGFLLCCLPSKFLISIFTSALSSLMDPPLRASVGFPEPSLGVTLLVNFFFFTRRAILLHLSLPRPNFLAVQRTVDILEESPRQCFATNTVTNHPSHSISDGMRTQRTSYIQTPYYLAPTIWSRYLSPLALLYRLLSLPLPGDGEGMSYRASGYTLSDLRSFAGKTN